MLSGWSAGGHLVAMALDHPRVAAGLAISGVYDLAPIRDTGLNNALKLTDKEDRNLSPLRLPMIHKRLAIAYGAAELPALVFDSIKLHDKRSRERAGRSVPDRRRGSLQHPRAICVGLTARWSISRESWSSSPAP